MPRRRRRDSRPDPGPPLVRGMARVQEHGDREWVVRPVSGAAAQKSYRCPGCQQLIEPGTAHTVAWPFDVVDGLEQRRHWHNPCWAAQDRRRPN